MLLLLACVSPGTAPAGGTGAGDTGGTGDTGDTVTTFGLETNPVPGEAPRPDVDVLVIGAGPAGLAAALEARNAGASVRVLEREDLFGGSANWAGALMLFSGTEEQAALGITDSPAQLLTEWPSFTGGDPEDPWVVYFAEQNVPMVQEWLRDLGVSWIDPTGDTSSGTTSRVHQVVGGGPALVAAIEAPLPGDTILFRSEAEALLTDRRGRVTGVQWRDLETDTTHVARAKAVIVATGGFMHDLERVREERPDLADRELRYGSWPGADGNGLTMIEALGGATENLDAVGIYAHGVPLPDDSLDEGRLSFLTRTPWFNNLGQRFVNEAEGNGFPTGEVRAAQPDGEAWSLFDAPLAASATVLSAVPGGPAFTLTEMMDAGLVVSADDIPGVGEALGIDGDTLLAEVQAYNEFLLDLSDTDAYRTVRDGSPPITAPPFYAVPIAITIAKGFGGVDVDLSGRVLDTDGAVIPGLYAAGELTGMAGGTLVGEYGFTGSLSAVVLGGRVAGAAAALE